MNAEGCPVAHPRRGAAVDIDPLLDESVFNPPSALYSETNQNSIVLRVAYGGVSFLFTGDVDAQVEGDILGRGFNLRSTVLKVAHHGSAYSSTSASLNSVSPEASVISVGAGNTYGHPSSQTLDRLAAAGSAIYRTDYNGNVVVRTDGTTRTVSVQKQSTPPTTTTTPPPPTTTPAPAAVAISSAHYDAAGNDWDNLNDEYIVVRNTGATQVGLSGWTLSDLASHVYHFPAGFTLAAGASVTIFTGSGTNSVDRLYWGSGAPIWNNDHDTAYLRDGGGNLVASLAW